MNIRDYNPADGHAFQGDIAIIPVPAELAILLDRSEEIVARDGRLILAEGEVTGHHHAIDVMEHPTADVPRSAAADALMADALANRIKIPTARMFRDVALASAMQRAGIITRTDLCIGFLEIEGAPFTIKHEEHNGIRVPEMIYYIGGQVESVGAEERRVAD